MPESFEHSPHLPVPTFSYNEFQLCPVWGPADQADTLGAGDSIIELDPFPQAAQHGRTGLSGNFHEIGFPDTEAGMGDCVHQIAVVSEKQKALALIVEPPHGNDSWSVRNQLDNRPTTLRV
jgi:hypothetical protein